MPLVASSSPREKRDLSSSRGVVSSATGRPARAGAGGGKVQYQSAVWPQDEQQAAVARQVATEKKSTVPVLKPTEWFDAEEYHRACPCPRSNTTSRRQSHCDFGLSPCAEDYIAKARKTYGR